MKLYDILESSDFDKQDPTPQHYSTLIRKRLAQYDAVMNKINSIVSSGVIAVVPKHSHPNEWFLFSAWAPGWGIPNTPKNAEVIAHAKKVVNQLSELQTKILELEVNEKMDANDVQIMHDYLNMKLREFNDDADATVAVDNLDPDRYALFLTAEEISKLPEPTKKEYTQVVDTGQIQMYTRTVNIGKDIPLLKYWIDANEKIKKLYVKWKQVNNMVM